MEKQKTGETNHENTVEWCRRIHCSSGKRPLMFSLASELLLTFYAAIPMADWLDFPKPSISRKMGGLSGQI